MYLPIFAHWLPEYRDIFHDIHMRTLDVARASGLDILDFKESIEKQSDVFGMYAHGKKGGHFSIEGYGLLADEIGKQLRNYGL